MPQQKGLDPEKAVEILKASGYEAIWETAADGRQIITSVVRTVDESSFGENYLEVEIDKTV